MIKYYAGYVEEHEAHLIGVGLTPDNLTRLKQGQPIAVNTDELGVPAPGCDFLISYAATPDEYGHQICEHFSRLNPNIDATLPCRIIDNVYCIIPIPRADHRCLYLLGLLPQAFSLLENRGIIVFRSRSRGNNAPTSIQLMINCGASVETLEETFYAKGMLNHETTIIKT